MISEILLLSRHEAIQSEKAPSILQADAHMHDLSSAGARLAADSNMLSDSCWGRPGRWLQSESGAADCRTEGHSWCDHLPGGPLQPCSIDLVTLVSTMGSSHSSKHGHAQGHRCTSALYLWGCLLLNSICLLPREAPSAGTCSNGQASPFLQPCMSTAWS